VVLGDTADTSKSGVLKIEGGKGALLVVGKITVNTASNVIADEESTVTVFNGLQVAAVGIAAVERTVFGVTEEAALVVIPAGNTRSSVEKADVYSDAEANVPVPDKKGSIAKPATVAENPGEVS
jgi:hypothetical protein